MPGVYLSVQQVYLDQFFASRWFENSIEEPQKHFFRTEYALKQVVVGPIDSKLCQASTLFPLLRIA
jgi:hypothetical protein